MKEDCLSALRASFIGKRAFYNCRFDPQALISRGLVQAREEGQAAMFFLPLPSPPFVNDRNVDLYILVPIQV